MTKRKLIVTVSILAVIFGSIGLMKLLASMKNEAPEKNQDTYVRYVLAKEVNYSTINSEIIAQGRVNTSRELDLISEANGKILQGSVILKKGTTFKKGNHIFQIYKDELELSLNSQKSKFMNSVAGILPDIKIDFPENYQGFINFFTSIDVNKPLPAFPKADNSKLKVFLASRGIAAEYYAIKQAELSLSRSAIYAPFDGAITQVYMEVGAYANMGAKVARIISTENLELEVPINNSDSKWIAIGNKVKINSSGRNKDWEGTISRFANFVDATTQSRAVFITIPNTNNDVLSGEYMTATFNTITVNDVMEIPRNCVFNQNEVFIIENNKLKKAFISIIKVNQQSILFNGVQKNTVIVTEPLIGAKEGDLVKILK